MASISSQLVLNDSMTAVLRKMNSALLICLDSFEAMQNASGNAIDVENIELARSQLIGVNSELEEMTNGQHNVNNAMQQGASIAQDLLGNITKMAGAYISVKSAVDFVKSSLDNAFEAQNINTQLATTLNNMGMGQEDYDKLTQKVKEYGMYTQTALTAGAAEFATYLSDSDAVETMMGTLTNYMAGMTGGGALDTNQVVNYATQLGKVLNGSYDGIAKKGFTVTETQKAIIDGTATQAQVVAELGEEYLTMSSEMQAAATVANIINESWGGLYENMTNTPEGQLITLQNTLNQMKEDMGTGLIPQVLRLVKAVQANLPTIQKLIDAAGVALNAIFPILELIIEGAAAVADFFINNWAWIEPIVWGIVGALVVYEAIQLACNAAALIGQGVMAGLAFATKVKAAADEMAAGKTFLATVQQYGFNAALLACPIAWFVAAIGALCVALAIFTNMNNQAYGTTLTFAGMLGGSLMTILAALGNMIYMIWDIVAAVVVAVWNIIVDFINFFGNVFKNPIRAIIQLFTGLLDTIIGVIEAIAGAIGKLFGQDWTSGFESFRATMKKAVDDTYGENEVFVEKLDDNAFSIKSVFGQDYIDYRQAFDAGYQLGDQIGDNVAAAMPEMPEAPDPFVFEQTEKNTSDTAEALSGINEDLKYLRDAAEQEAINRFTTAEVKIDMSGMTNRIDSDMDLDGILTTLTEGFAEALETTAEGVHA